MNKLFIKDTFSKHNFMLYTENIVKVQNYVGHHFFDTIAIQCQSHIHLL